MRSKLPKTTAHPTSYFEHNERQHNPRAVHMDVIEWPPPIEVRESTSEAAIERVRIAWLNSIKESQK